MTPINYLLGQNLKLVFFSFKEKSKVILYTKILNNYRCEQLLLRLSGLFKMLLIML